jgi:truncated hemoglobin YjbI
VNKDVTRTGVITTFHERRVLSLMRQARLLDEMVPNAPLKETVLMMEGLDREKIKKRIKSVLGSVPLDTALYLHPPMRPDDGFIEMVSTPHSSTPSFSLRPFGFSFHRLTRGSGGCRGIST